MQRGKDLSLYLSFSREKNDCPKAALALFTRLVLIDCISTSLGSTNRSFYERRISKKMDAPRVEL